MKEQTMKIGSKEYKAKIEELHRQFGLMHDLAEEAIEDRKANCCDTDMEVRIKDCVADHKEIAPFLSNSVAMLDALIQLQAVYEAPTLTKILFKMGIVIKNGEVTFSR
jgi:hypothetical protein